MFTNPDPNPVSNYVSIDDLSLSSPGSQMQPAIDDSDLAVVWKSSGGSSWSVNRGHTPIYEVTYGDGYTQGQRYMDARSSSGVVTVGGGTQARQVFTPRSQRSIGAVHARVRNGGSSSPLVFDLTENGQVVASASVPASSVSSSYSWVSASLAYTLKAGASYALVLRSSGGPFSVFPYQKGTNYGFANPFPDGHADGSSSDLDFPVYFT